MDDQSTRPINPPIENSVQPVVSTQSAATPPAAKSFVSTKVILLIVIVLIIMGAGGTYLALNSKTKPAPIVSKAIPTSTPTPITDPTASWRTYKNAEFGFSIKYPAAFIIEDISTKFPPLSITIKDSNKQLLGEGGGKFNPGVHIQIQSDKMPLDEYLLKYKNNLIVKNKQTINGAEFTIINAIGAPSPPQYLINSGHDIISISNSSLDDSIFQQRYFRKVKTGRRNACDLRICPQPHRSQPRSAGNH